MNYRRFRFVGVVLAFLTVLAPGLVTGRGDSISRKLKRYDSVMMDTAAIARHIRTDGKLSLGTADGLFEIDLIPNDIRSPGYRAEEVDGDGRTQAVQPEAIRTYRGTVRGIASSEARFSVTDDVLEGLVLTPGDWYFVEPMRNYDPSASQSELIVYRASDIQPGALGTCGTSLSERIGRSERALLPEMAQATGSISVAQVATEADYEFVTSAGGSAAANNAILDIMNQVDAIYKTQLSISLQVAYQHTWATSSDPYFTTAPSGILTEFTSYWTSNLGSIGVDLAHMWTGKDMDGSTVGIAYLDVVCNARSHSYGVSQALSSAPAKYIVSAHEIGHNFGATHTDQADVPPTDCSNTIMNSYIGTGTTFCPYSRNEIAGHLASYSSCLTPAVYTSRCDINADGQISVLDLQTVANSILGFIACPGNCDTNNDGKVDVLDVQLLVNGILGLVPCP